MGVLDNRGLPIGCARGCEPWRRCGHDGAIYGQLAGAYFGANAIPAEWREQLAKGSAIQQMADDLFGLANEWPRSASGGSQGEDGPIAARDQAYTLR